MKVIINYKPTKEKVEEFDVVKILKQEDVFIDLPVAIVDFGVTYNTPILYGNYKGIPTIVEKEELLEHLKTLEIHYFNVDGDKLISTSKEESQLTLRLPKGTNTDELMIHNGEVVWAKPVEQEKENIIEVEQDGTN